MRQYVRGLAEVGARVFGVGDTPPQALPQDSQHYLSGYLQVPRIMDEDDVIERVSAWLRGREMDRVLTNWEPLVILAARLRERWGMPGMTADTALGFRDKALMKQRVEAAGLRVPRSARAQTASEVRAAAEEIGYPLVVKPISGAGAADTFRVEDTAELEAVLGRVRHVPEVSVEEYIEGEERTYDTVCIGGKPVYENVAHYLPKPIEARHKQWISPVIITVRDLDQPEIRRGIELGRGVLGALGMDDGFTHMEWFSTPSGEAVFGEVGARPGGACIVPQMNYTSDIDLFREWARAVCWGAFEADTTRHYNCGITFKRAQGEGRIQRITGLDAFRQRCGRWLVEDALLPVGAVRRDWTQTLLSDGHLMIRHPDWEEAKRLSFAAATDVQLYAG
ncbi:MAG: ATP-grasp domain-containing protein [Deltaproteobacteria bacterium]|nr:ATP-grasp domain-containing protein [Deltaproteobacteria bacterium]